MNVTPGEWEAKEKLGVILGLDTARWMVGNGQSAWVAICGREQDARLIAAAPDMYEALKAVLDSIVCNDDMSISYAIDGLARCQIDNALSKAESIA